MSQHPHILIHDADGFTQADRRVLLLKSLRSRQARHPALWAGITWTEEPDGVTLWRDGVALERITYAELVAVEAAVEESQSGQA